METYIPGSFSNVYERNEGEKIWAFLHTPESITRMETATYLVRPAGEALAPTLISKFGEAVKHDEVKRMIGHMIRQIIEPLGYEIDKTGVNITRDPCLFKRATRYKENVERKVLGEAAWGELMAAREQVYEAQEVMAQRAEQEGKDAIEREVWMKKLKWIYKSNYLATICDLPILAGGYFDKSSSRKNLNLVRKQIPQQLVLF